MAGTNLRISLIQLDIAWENPAANIARLEHMLKDLPDTDLIILPEMWATGFSMQPVNIAEPASGPSVQWMKKKASEKKAAIAGSLSTIEGSTYVNRFYLVYPDQSLKTYDKKHLFSYGGEDLQYEAGQDAIEFDILGWKIRPIICYDLRFPVWCRNTTDYDMLLVVANWPAPRIHHWDALIKARAIENQCYLTAVNRVGTDGNGLIYTGHSGVTDMNGTLISDLGETESIQQLTLDKAALEDYRQHFQFLRDRDSFTIHTALK